LAKLKDRLGIVAIAWVGDRGMITSAHIEVMLMQPQRGAAGGTEPGGKLRACSSNVRRWRTGIA
jgi:hypothetical protein